MSITLSAIITGLLLLVTAIMIIRPYFPAPVAAFMALAVGKWCGLIHPQSWLIISWAVVVVTVTAIDIMQPRAIARATNGLTFIGTGALAGMMAGMTLFSSISIAAGAAIGAIAGGFAYRRSPGGAALRHNGVHFRRYLLAKGFPAVVAATIAGIVILYWISEHPTIRTTVG